MASSGRGRPGVEGEVMGRFVIPPCPICRDPRVLLIEPGVVRDSGSGLKLECEHCGHGWVQRPEEDR